MDYGENIEVPLDYRPNPDGGFLVSDQDQSAMLKTEVITSAVYEIAQISYSVTWTKGDEAKNPSPSQKISLVKSILENGIQSHDDLLERAIFTSSTAGGVEFNGLDALVPNNGQGTPGGIDAGTETFWRNPADTYTNETDIEATFVDIYNAAAKGSGASLVPKLMLGGATPHALYESSLAGLQRFVDSNEADGGFKALAFKTIPFIFSQYGADEVYFINPKNYKLTASKTYFRDKGQTYPIPGQNAWNFLIYSAVQAVVDNKSRLGVAYLT